MTAAEIKERRQSLRLSQAKLAARLGVTVNAVAKWEAGHTHPPPYLWRALRDIERELAEAPA